MRMLRLVATAITLTTAAAIPARAQEPGKVGLTMSTESAVGLTIEAAKWLSIRPEVGFSRATSEIAERDDLTTTNWRSGLSVLFHVKSWDSTRLYLAPQWTHSRLTSSTSSSKSSGDTYSGMVGAQHSLTNRFAAFGEVGLERSTSESESQFSTSSARSWKTRSSVGVILFF